MKFTNLNLHPKILQAIEACGYTQPTPIQSKAIPNILDGKDIIASAQTGTGKTASYVLPGLQKLMGKKTTKKPRILILAPTRELATQITKVIGKYGKLIKPNIASFVGGMPYGKQLRELSRPIDFIIATPGRLMDHMENKRLDLSHIEMLIIDEADRMLDMGFIDDIKTIVKETPKNRQTLLFSATADDKLISTTKDLLKKPIKIEISQEKIDTSLIKQKTYVATSSSSKRTLLEHILDQENIFKAIIFSSTKRNAAKLATQLSDDGYKASPMHGDLKQSARNRTLTNFRIGKIQFLVATDVAARGIDVTDITHIINYDLPRLSEDYVHRIGRTGRAGKTGVAISLMLEDEIYHLKKIEKYINYKMPLFRITEDGEKEIKLDAKPKEKRGRGEGKGRGRNTKSGDTRKQFKKKRSDTKDKPKTKSRFGDTRDQSKKKRSDTKDKPKTKSRFGDTRDQSKKKRSDTKDKPKTRNKFGDTRDQSNKKRIRKKDKNTGSRRS